VIQLVVLGSLARTIRARTLILAMTAGLYACAPFAVLLAATWTRLMSWMTGASVLRLVETGAYGVDPFIEEMVKVLPLIVLLMVPTIRRQWSITDCVLMGAASGSGFGLAEALYRFGSSPHSANSTDHGWILATSADLPFVPNVWTTITSWLPSGVDSSDIYFPGVNGHPWVNLHLAWSAIAGLAIGLIVLRRTVIARVAGAILLLYVGTDHAAWNATHAYGSWVKRWLVGPFEAQRYLLPFLPLAALGVAWTLDRQRQRTRDSGEVVLATELGASPRFVGTLRAALSQLPSSLLSTAVFVRLRRAYNSARFSGYENNLADLRGAVISARARVGLEPLSWSRWTDDDKRRRFRPTTIIGLILLSPFILYFLVAGWPQTSWLQKTMTGSAIWKIVLPLSVLSQIWLVWQAIVSFRVWPKCLKLPLGEDVASVGLRIAGVVGSASLGVIALLRILQGFSPTQFMTSNAHAIEAINDLVVGAGLMLSGGAVGFLTGSYIGGDGAGGLLNPLGREAYYAEQEDAAAKAAWEQAVAGSKAALKNYERARAPAAKQEAISEERHAAFERATDARDAAVAGGNQAAIDRANTERSKAQIESMKASGDAEAAKAAQGGARTAANAAFVNEQKALGEYRSAAEMASYVTSKRDAAAAKPDKP
jgi:RsiW-degrading membrane proteinase PrsW (M82 family)